MSFIYPLGLLGLIGIPILVIIYLIKNKYTEQIITSTYLWTLSEKFLKKKKQVKTLSGIISLILQILTVILITLTLSHVLLLIPNSAKEYCFILDASGSMNMVVEEKTKMEIGKEKIEEIINNSTNGSKYTLVYAGSTSRVVYEKISDKEKAKELLANLEPSGVTVSFSSTLKYVQEYFNNNPSLVTYLVTDRDYKSANMNIINVSDKLDNYAIINPSYMIEGDQVSISGKVVSYLNDQKINLDIYINDKLETTLNVDTKKAEETNFEYVCKVIDFSEIFLQITNNDSLMIDNNAKMYNVEKEHDYSTLIISDRPFYLESIIKTIGGTSIEVVSRDNYDASMRGYSLYIFDSYAPGVLPTDGAIWLFGTSSSIESSGFSAQDIIAPVDENMNEIGMELSYAKNSTSEFKNITRGLSKEKIYVSKYVKYNLYRNFTTILTHEGNPIIFSGATDSGNIEVVFAFDLHDSNLPLLMDYIVLTKNLLTYSFPSIVEKSNYICGEEALINVRPEFDSIRVEKPNGDVSYLSVNSAKSTLKLNEAGIYKLTIMSGDETQVFNLYASMPTEESKVEFESVELNLSGELKNEYTNGIYDNLLIIFIILAVVFAADWVVYCYEQHQLR